MRHQITLYAILSLLLATSGSKAEPLSDKDFTSAQFSALATWVAANANLPYAELPQVKFVPPGQLERLRYRRMLGPLLTPGGERPSQAIGGEYSTPRPNFHGEIVALYDDTTETIYLPESWTGTSKAEQSVLVHELVHHLQNRAMIKYECAGAREKPAYLAQKRWLESYGLDFEHELEVDMFTVVAMSACME